MNPGTSEIFHAHPDWPWDPPASWTMGTGSLYQEKSNQDVALMSKIVQSYTSTQPLGLHDLLQSELDLFTFLPDLPFLSPGKLPWLGPVNWQHCQIISQPVSPNHCLKWGTASLCLCVGVLGRTFWFSFVTWAHNIIQECFVGYIFIVWLNGGMRLLG